MARKRSLRADLVVSGDSSISPRLIQQIKAISKNSRMLKTAADVNARIDADKQNFTKAAIHGLLKEFIGIEPDLLVPPLDENRPVLVSALQLLVSKAFENSGSHSDDENKDDKAKGLKLIHKRA